MMNKNYIILIFLVCVMIFPLKDLHSQDYLDFLSKDAVEAPEFRTENSKTFFNSDSSRTILIFNCAVHELDKNGEWQDASPFVQYFYSDPITTVKKTATGYRLPNILENPPEPLFSAGKTSYSTDRSFIYWDTHLIEVGSNVTKCEFTIPQSSTPLSAGVTGYNITRLTDNPKLPQLPTSAQMEARWTDILNTHYNPTQIEPVFTYTLTSTSSTNALFRTDLISRLAQGWMAVGVKDTDEVFTSKNIVFNSLFNNVTLAVTYYPPQSHYSFNVSPLQTQIPGSGGSANISILNTGTAIPNGGVPPIEFSQSAPASWLTVSSSSNHTPATLILTATANSTSSTRTTTITLTATDPPSGVTNPSRTVTITQPPNAPVDIHLDYTSWSAPTNGGSKTIHVTSSDNSALGYTVSEQADWLSLSSGSGTTPSDFNIIAQGNFTGVARFTEVRVTSGSINKYIQISQNAASTLTLPAEEISGMQSYSATDWIIANSFVVGTGGNVSSLTLRAGNKITLSPGFNAKSDAGTFRAYIQPFTGEESSPISQTKESKEILSLKDKTKAGSKEKSGNQTDVTTIETLPTEYDLFQNYPNPFNPTTTIRFALPEKAFVRLGVFNLLGQQVGEISNTEFDAGFHSVNFNGSSLSSGMYFYRITTDKFTKTLKLLLVK